MTFIRLLVFGLIGLSVIYFSIALYARSLRKERLEADFDARHSGGGDATARKAFIAEGLAAHERALRPKLIGLIYVLPVVAMGITIFVINAR